MMKSTKYQVTVSTFERSDPLTMYTVRVLRSYIEEEEEGRVIVDASGSQN